MKRSYVSSGTSWESSVGYSRAVRVGNQVFVSGTTATNADGTTFATGDPYRQTQFILKRIEHALREVGGSMNDVVRTRMFVTNIDQWEEIGRAHGECFADVRPAATMVEVKRLISPDHLVEIEVDAIVV